MISVCCPTRGRPESMRRLVESVRATADGPVEIIFYLDDDDPDSAAMAAHLGTAGLYGQVMHIIGKRITMSDTWNVLARHAAYEILMACGDDVVFRTAGWDTQVCAAFAAVDDRIVLVHGDDLVHGPRLATHPFLHRRWINAVGYLVPDGFSADHTDTWVQEVADALGRRRYLPDVVTEHLHPIVGKARLDDTHRQRLARDRCDNNAAAYAARAAERGRDVAILRALLQPVDAPEIVTVQAAPELLGQMQGTWSQPVEVYLQRGPDGWEMTFRTHACQIRPVP